MRADSALLQLLKQLECRNYRFTAVTPATHALVLSRPRPPALDVRDIFGWNRSFAPSEIDPAIVALLEDAGAVEDLHGALRSRFRVATLGERLFLHSSFPTDGSEAVFFGPDTYRFAGFVLSELSTMQPPDWIVDMGAGTGAGGIAAAARTPTARVTLVDINPAAARLAEINGQFAGAAVEVAVADQIPEGSDLVIANPPYMIDSAHRIYRDGGDLFGGEIALDWVRQALSSLTPGGTLLLYTGAAVIAGTAPLLEKIRYIVRQANAQVSCRELDPDVFGEELSKPEYSEVERIAAVGIKVVNG